MTGSYSHEPIAIIGLDCIYPGAPDAKSFWRNIINKVSSVGDPLPAWDADFFLDEKKAITTQKGGYLKDLYRFNPVEFGIMPSSIDGGEPDQFLALDIAYRTLADAGDTYVDKAYNHKDTGVIIGHSTYYHRGQISLAQHYGFVEQTRQILHAMIPNMTSEQDVELERLLHDQLPAFNADISPGLVPNVLTGRIANRLNLRGPNYIVDAACASSLLAIGAAIDELRSGRSRMMIAGGVNASLPPEVSVIFTRLDALSKSGKVRPFSTQADGTLLGEGLGMVALKRQSDALADGDRIYAVLHGVGQSSDGRGLGLLTPSMHGETLAMQRTYDDAKIDPASLSLIEAHGTGIRLGDQTEFTAMSGIFGKRKGQEGHIAVGSVKSMISHTIPAAGVASVIKTSLALHHKILPPTLCDEISPDLGIQDSALYINTETRPWYHSSNAPRRAGVNSFGFGGVNAHAILEEAPAAAIKPTRFEPWAAQCCIIAGATPAALQGEINRVESFIAARSDLSLEQIARVLWLEHGASDGPHKLAIVAKDIADLSKKISQAKKKLGSKTRFSTRNGITATDAPLEGKLAFMFPGEGSQYLNMLADLAQHFPSVRRWLDFWHQMGETGSRTDVVYPRESELTEEKRKALRTEMFSMTLGSEAMIIAGQAMFDCLQDLGVKPDVMVGHSSGESGALMAAGVVKSQSAAELAENFKKISTTSQKIQADGLVPTGALIAIGLIDIATINDVLAGSNAMIAMENCQQQTIIFTSNDDAEGIIKSLSAAGAVCERLAFDRGYHTPAFQPMQDAFEDFYTQLGVHAPNVPLYSCATGGIFPDTPDEICKLAAVQWTKKVRFTQTIRNMYTNDNVRAFVEVGPGGKLSAFTSQILADEAEAPLMISSSNLEGRCGVTTLMQLMGQLWASGLADLDQLFAGRDEVKIKLDDLVSSKRKGLFLDNSIPKIKATPELTAFLQTLSPNQNATHDVSAHVTGGSTIQSPVQPASRVEYAQPELATSELVASEYPQTEQTQAEYTQDSDYPFLSRITTVQDNLLEAEVDLDVAQDLYLQDHILSGPVSEDPNLRGLSCVPLMVSLEIMAEAGAALLGRRDLSVIENLVGSRWLVLEQEQKMLTVCATKHTNETVEVQIQSDGSLAVSVRLSFGPIDAPTDEIPAVINEEEYCAPGAYETYQEHIFHGPVFQSIEYVTAWSKTGIEATLSDVTLEGFFRPGAVPNMILNPVLFDAFTQLTAFWLAHDIGSQFASFPRFIPRIEIYAHIADACDGLWMRAARAGELGNGQDGVWEIACYHEDTPVVRMSGLQNAFSILPEAYYHYSPEPLNGWLGAPAAVDQTSCVWDMPLIGASFWNSVGGVFLRILGFSTLTREERVVFSSMGDDLMARQNWLMSRVAAKEAVRFMANHLTGLRAYSCDIQIEETSGAGYIAWLSEGHDTQSYNVQIDKTQPGLIRAIAEPTSLILTGLTSLDVTQMETT